MIGCSSDSVSKLDVQVLKGLNGLVTITASADGALNYRFSFNDNAVDENTSG